MSAVRRQGLRSIEPKPTQSARSNTTYDRLLLVAAELFWQRGYEATTTRDLAQAMGLQKASLYHHITRKEDVLFDLCKLAIERLNAAVAATVSEGTPPLEQLQSLIETHMEVVLRDRQLQVGVLNEFRYLSSDHWAAVVSMRDSYQSTVRSIIESCQRNGVLRKDISPATLTLALLDLLNWAIFWFKPEGPMTPTMIARSFAAIFLDGAVERSESKGPKQTSSRPIRPRPK